MTKTERVAFTQSWRRWWATLSPQAKFLPVLAIALYWYALRLLGGLHSDHLIIGLIILILTYGGRGARTLLGFLMPFLLTGIIYDSQRWYSDYLRLAIHVQEPYVFDKVIFGIHTSAGLMTPNEFWQHHLHPALDLITGFAYLVFFGAFMLIAAYFRFYAAPRGTQSVSPARMEQLSKRMTWAFLWLNLLGYSTYYWFAAAPPWYVERYGLGPANMNVQASQAGCVRFDQLLGTHFFSDFYGKAADVFGAVPSLHVSYPLLAVLFAFQFGILRVGCIFFYLIMCFSAVYLNHHYILDIVWGSAYTFFIYWLIHLVQDYREGILP